MYFVMHVSRLLFLMVFGFESGCKTKYFAREVMQKSTFAEVGILMIPGSIFHDFGWRWDEFSCLLLPWRLACNLMALHGYPGAPPDPSNMPGGRERVAFWP